MIRRMSVENPLWGAPRIHGELLKLGIEVAQSSVGKYMIKRQGPPSQGWRTFLRNHAQDIAARGIRDKPTAPERLIGSIRRECVDHIIVLGEMHLRRVLKSYADYYNSVRTHRSLNKDAPVSRPVQRIGSIKSHAILGGLHHHYARA